MNRSRFVRIAVILIVGAIGLTFVLMGPGVLEAGSKAEYKFVRLVDEGAMPAITEALNREAELGWELEEMAVVPGEPGAVAPGSRCAAASTCILFLTSKLAQIVQEPY